MTTVNTFQGIYLCDRRRVQGVTEYRMVWEQQVHGRRIRTWEPLEQLTQDGWEAYVDHVDRWIREGRNPPTFYRWAREQHIL
jgi:hypothetical protein